MKCAEVFQYCRELPQSEQKTLDQDGTAIAFVAAEKPFAFFETGAPIQWKFSIQVTEELYEALHRPPKVRQTDKGEGFWLTIIGVDDYPEDELVEMIDWSYQQSCASNASA